jgi:hypothetical protein
MMCIYTLSQGQIDFIEENFFEFSFDNEDELPDKSLFDQLSHPAELFYLAHTYNWDDGIDVLQWVVDSPLCSVATASLIFWRSQPDYYRRYNLSGDTSVALNDDEVLSLLHSIIKKYENNSFSSIALAFDPAPELESLTAKDPKWDVPNALFKKLDGLELHAPS